MEFTSNYYPVSESMARRAKEMMSFSNYSEGSATGDQRYYVDAIVSYANEILKKHPTEDADKIAKAQYYIDKYSRKVAEAIDKQHAIDCRCPSVMIAGPSNFPVRKKEKQNAAAEAHWRSTRDLYYRDSRNYYYNKIRLALVDSGVIKSDDENATDKIKAKIARLDVMEDPFGNNKAEIRRLKERLLVLSPDEVKAGKEVMVNGKPATYENIVGVFDSFKPQRSVYTPDENRFYLSIPLVFSDGSRKYKGYISNEVDESGENWRSYGNAENNYQPIWKPLDDLTKYLLVIGQVNGSGNKAVVYSILKDLDPRNAKKEKAKEDSAEGKDEVASTITINGEPAVVKENQELVRLQILFSDIPQKETREILKSNGFKWAPSQSAWQRLLNENARLALRRIQS